MAGEDEPTKRKPDEPLDMIGIVAEDMMDAFKKGDKGLLRQALEALVEHVQAIDEEQDEGMA